MLKGLNLSTIDDESINSPSIAQLVERWTVEVQLY